MTRMLTADASPKTFGALLALDARLKDSLGPVLHDLVKLRASQLNGCAFCVDMHATDLEALGVPTRTIHNVAAWHDSPLFDDTQRVALAITETLTGGVGTVDDQSWDDAGRLLGDQGRADLLMTIGVITTMNMLSITTHMTPPTE